MTRRNSPPFTDNPEAASLIRAAADKCAGCRTNWRLVSGTFKHPVPGGTVECWAADERAELRAIAARGRGK